MSVPLNILLVDPQPTLRIALRALLASVSDLCLVEAFQSFSALAKISSKQPVDVILFAGGIKTAFLFAN